MYLNSTTNMTSPVTDLHSSGDRRRHHLAVRHVGNLDQEAEAQLSLEQLQLLALFCIVLGSGQHRGEGKTQSGGRL